MTLRLPLSITLAQAESEPAAQPAPNPGSSPAPSDAPPTPPAGLQSGDGSAPTDGTNATAQQPGSANQQLPPDDGGGGMFPPMLLLVVLALFMLMLFWGQHRDKKKKKELLGSIEKGDKVQTVGGIIGTITDLKENELTLKVDENTNTKMKFSRSAVQTVLRDKSEED